MREAQRSKVFTPELSTVGERLELALSGSRIAWFERDLDSGLVTGSPSCAEIFGLADPLGPWPYEDFVALILPEDKDVYLSRIQAQVEQTKLVSNATRYRIRRPDGAIRHIEARYGEIREPDRRYRFGLVMDVTDLSVLTERLNDNSAWLDLAMDSINMVLWDRDLVNGTFRTSANYGAFYGLPAGRTDWNFAEFLATVHPDDHVTLRTAYDAAVAHDHEYGPKYRILGPDGVERWLESKGRLQRDAEGRPKRLVGVTWDVSERRMSEERLLGIANLVPGMVYQLQRTAQGQYHLRYVSEGIRGLCGLDPESARASATHFMRHIHPDDREHFRRSSELSAAELRPWHEEFRMLDTSGTPRWAEGRALPQRSPDGVVTWHGHIFDISARKSVESDLLETKGRLTLALAAARMITWRWNIATDEISSPQDLGEFFDLPAHAPTMADILGNIHPEDRAHIAGIIRQAISRPSDETLRLDFRVLRANDKMHLLEARARAEFDDNGQLKGFQGVTVDLTEQRIGDQERNALQDQLRQAQKMELLGLMTGGIAHDFNNILASILGYAGLAARPGDDALSAKKAAYIEEIRLAASRGAELVNQMLAFSRGETGLRSPQSLAEQIKLAVKMLRPTFPSSIDIVMDLAPDLPLVATTAVEIQQIVMNLCINARDAMPDAGSIVLSLEHRHQNTQACASCGADIDGEFVVLTVADDGTGIEEQARRRIFEPLFSTKTHERGTGLGLAMVHSIVHRGGGHITVTTALNEGTRFEIHFPAAHPLAAATQPFGHDGARDAATGAARRAHILVVDDECAVASLLGEMLTLDGHDVHIECDPLAALKTFRAAPTAFDLVISDQTMPKLIGTELAMRCRAIRPDLPVILVTGHSTTVNATVARELGIDALLAKPIDMAALAKEIDRALGVRQTFGSG